jgi:hypothetical protein
MALETLNADEQKYFDSKGAAAPVSPAPVVAETAPEPGSDPAAARSAVAEPKTVPLAALHEERERRKELQRQIDDVNRRADERFNLIAQKLAASAPAAESRRDIPDPEKDAVGAIRMTAEEVKVLSDFKRQVEAQAAQSQAIQAVFAHASRLENEFESRTPDFQTASAFLRETRARELATLGVDPYRVQQILGLEKLQLAQAALQQGRNPAEIIYALAKMRGYAPNAAAAKGRAANGEGEAAKLARIAKGQEAGTSLGAATGAAPGKTGIEALLGMSDAEFASALDKMSAEQLRHHFGN